MATDSVDRVLDVRWLDPPEPFEQVVAALDGMPAGSTLRVLIHREPLPLYRMLDESGCRHRTHFDERGFFEIIIDC